MSLLAQSRPSAPTRSSLKRNPKVGMYAMPSYTRPYRAAELRLTFPDAGDDELQTTVKALWEALAPDSKTLFEEDVCQ